MQPVNDTKEQEDLKNAFPDGKPSVEEFIAYAAGLTTDSDDDDLPFD